MRVKATDTHKACHETLRKRDRLPSTFECPQSMMRSTAGNQGLEAMCDDHVCDCRCRAETEPIVAGRFVLNFGLKPQGLWAVQSCGQERCGGRVESKQQQAGGVENKSLCLAPFLPIKLQIVQPLQEFLVRTFQIKQKLSRLVFVELFSRPHSTQLLQPSLDLGPRLKVRRQHRNFVERVDNVGRDWMYLQGEMIEFREWRGEHGIGLQTSAKPWPMVPKQLISLTAGHSSKDRCRERSTGARFDESNQRKDSPGQRHTC